MEQVATLQAQGPLKTTQVSVEGKWVSVSAIEINSRAVVTSGKWIKIAAIQDEYWQATACEDPETYIRALRQSHGFSADIFAFMQKLPEVTPKYPYPVDWDNVAAIKLSTYQNWFDKLSPETRRNVRLAAKRGVITRVVEFNDDLINAIVCINSESPLRQGRRFPHYGKDFAAVKRDYESFLDRSVYIGAYLNGELIAFLKIVCMGPVAGIMQLLSRMEHYDRKPANALIAKAVEHFCAAGKFSYLTYIRYHYGNKHKSPLTEFKRRNGFEEIAIPRFFVPLTTKGKIAIALNLHRSLVEILPEKAIYPLLALRTKWQKFAMRSSGEVR
jgi:hypothetical protein